MEPHSEWIEDLLKNNHSPSDEAVQEVKELLVRPLKDLEDLDARIIDLKNRLSELEGKRDDTQKKISQYGSILAPIRRVPPDVLGEIFLRCLPTNRNPIMKSTECPLLLTRVCSPWRAAAMLSPRLWERIHITFTDGDTVPDIESAVEMVRCGLIAAWQNAPSRSEKELTTAVLRRKYEAVKEWLSRSGTRPLSISLSLPSTYWYKAPYSERAPGVTMGFLSFLATLAPRLRDLELVTSSEIYEVLEKMVKVSEMTMLTSLRIEYPVHFSRLSDSDATPDPKLFHAPHLRNLSIASGDSRLWNTSPSIRWSQLTDISCFDTLTIEQIVLLLQRSSNLVHFKGIISDHTDGDVPFQYDGYIPLLFLQSFSVTQYVSPRRLGELYNRIDAPLLQSVSYTTEFYAPPGDFSTNSTAGASSVIPILPLLKKSTELKKLTLEINQSSVVGQIATLLEAVPTITHLYFGSPESYGSSRDLPRLPHAGHIMSGLPEKDLRGFGNLIVHEHIEHPLLPRLTSLVIRSPNAPISDDTLFDLIKSRMAPSRTTALERVKVICYRERERDVEGELAGYAKLVGSSITMDLRYAQPHAPKANPISPEFGLTEYGPKGRSWRYIDAGEDLQFD